MGVLNNMSEIDQLKKEIEQIKKRNNRVELEKAWETSWVRRIAIVSLTYIVMILVFTIINVEKPFINAIIPTMGYFLSTLSMSFIEKKWKKKVLQ